MHTFDETREHATLLEVGKPPRFVQGGRIFSNHGEDLGEDPNFQVQQAEESLAAVAAEEASTEEVTDAEKRLGDMGGTPPEFVDPDAAATRENQAALNAEQQPE